jgi:predicted metal-binding membrane protein
MVPRKGGKLGNSAVRGRSRTDVWLPAVLLTVAGLGWWWSALIAGDMRSDAISMQTSMQTSMDMSMDTSMKSMPAMSLPAFLVAWVAMLAAMMLPGIMPVVRRDARTGARNAVSVIIFVGGYLAMWSAAGIPAFLAWSGLNHPVTQAHPWAGRVAGAVAVAAGLYQLTPLKTRYMRDCRVSVSPRPGGQPDGPAGAFLAGGRYGMFCLGSCWMLMTLLLALGTMQLAPMLALAVLIWLEKVSAVGDRLRGVTAAMLVLLGVVLLVHPALVAHLASLPHVV